MPRHHQRRKPHAKRRKHRADGTLRPSVARHRANREAKRRQAAEAAANAAMRFAICQEPADPVVGLCDSCASGQAVGGLE